MTGSQPLDVLLAERAKLIGELASLRAKYGPFGTFDAECKIRLSKVAGMVRAQAVEAGTKLTEAAIGDLSHADDRYAAYIEEATFESARWAVLEHQVQAINDRIARGQVLGRYAATEAALAR